MGKRKEFIGTVVSDKMDKTVVVMVETLVKHPLYGKYIKRRKKFMAHDENNECKIGDKVLIEETRPLSKRKRWRVKQIIERGKVLEKEPFIEGGE
ncbi:MAG: 30S ribosomal protein S17 [Caldimicrobium sp.]|jgi:small subunit ribosomal protein S17